MDRSLLLHAMDVRGPEHWRWLLTDQAGVPLADDHEVSLQLGTAEFEAFTDLYSYLRWHATPDDRAASEAQLVARIGKWAGKHVLGNAIGCALVAQAPVTVRVRVPVDAGFLVSYPLELAYACGEPLAGHGVTLVFEMDSDRVVVPKRPIEDQLRILALFSMPTDRSALALRRERHNLATLVNRVSARLGFAVKLRVLQYGVTRERLNDVAADNGDGWDILHVSGHGDAGGIFLEKQDGSADLVSTQELVRLLRPTRHRLKIAVLSACSSGAATAAETLRWLGLTEQAGELEDQASASAGGRTAAVGLAQGLVTEFGVAALGMRYPVDDEFAIAMLNELYPRLWEKRQPLDIAVGQAVAEAAGPAPSLSAGTPVLLGPAVGLTLVPPRVKAELDPYAQKMPLFPKEPERFVGRTKAMSAATLALAPQSDRAGVLFCGMAGAGKTACAIELAYHHRDWFEGFAWWTAPSQTEAFVTALDDFATAMEDQLGHHGFTMTRAVGGTKKLAKFVPWLTALLRTSGLLLVMDNLETLLTVEGTWRDPRWSQLMTALTDHRGHSRVILTSQLVPNELEHRASILIEPVHALSPTESVILAQELPHLRSLLHAEPGPPHPAPANVAADRSLVRRTLEVVQGHPKLLELADAAAADPMMLAARLDAVHSVAVAGGASLAAFFTPDGSTLDTAQFLAMLRVWTTNAVAVLPAPSKLLAGLLACMEDQDRNSVVLDAVWPALCREMQVGPVPDRAIIVESLVAGALIETRPFDPPAPGTPVRYEFHPAVAEAIRGAIEATQRSVFDKFVGGGWTLKLVELLDREKRGEPTSIMIVHAALSTAPYLLRQQEWKAAATVVAQAIRRDSSPQTSRRALAYLDCIPDDGETETASPRRGLRASVLANVDREQGALQLRRVLDDARAQGSNGTASAAASDLVNVLRAQGHLTEALELAKQHCDMVRLSDRSPWAVLAAEAQRLRVLTAIGHRQQVLEEVTPLLTRMDHLPAKPSQDETELPSQVRELLLDVAREAAVKLAEWDRVLEFSGRIRESMARRGAGRHELAHSAFNDHGVLLALGRLAEAEQMLRDCQEVFENHQDTARLGLVLCARAEVASKRTHYAHAVDLQQTALRYAYLSLEPHPIAVGHARLSAYLIKTNPTNIAGLAHLVTAALIYVVSDQFAGYDETMRKLARHADKPETYNPPVTFDTLADVVEVVPGIRFRQLVTMFAPDPAQLDALVAELVTLAQHYPDGHLALPGVLNQWTQLIAVVSAAADGFPGALATIDEALAAIAQDSDMTGFVAVLRRIVDGERDPSLLDDLEPRLAGIVAVILHQLGPVR